MVDMTKVMIYFLCSVYFCLMVILEIQGENGMEEFKLHKDFKRQQKLKDELFSRFRDEEIVTLIKDGQIDDRLQLQDLFDKTEKK
jgi:hypothetical protein